MQGLERFAQVESSGGLIFRLDPRVKIILLGCFSLFSVVLDRWPSLLCLTGLALTSALMARLDWGKLKLMLLLAGMVTWGTMLSQAIFYYGEPRTVLWHLAGPETPILGPLLGELNFYREGFEYGALQSLRFSAMTIFGLVFCWTTDSAAMFRGMVRVRVPFVLAFMTVTAVRFLPVIIEEFRLVMVAWRMRRGRIIVLNPLATVRNWLGIIRPVLINCYRRSNILALSIQARAFSPQTAAGAQEHDSLPPGARLVLWGGVGFTLAVTAGKILYWLYLAGIFYSSGLRWLYELNRLYL